MSLLGSKLIGKVMGQRVAFLTFEFPNKHSLFFLLICGLRLIHLTPKTPHHQRGIGLHFEHCLVSQNVIAFGRYLAFSIEFGMIRIPFSGV
jgi:hypothetical protein